MDTHGQGTWRHTKLWAELKRRQDTPSEMLRAVIVGVMPDIETVLTDRGTSSADFTLHDAFHSYRVANFMADLAGPDVLEQLGPQDIALLLLSAYVHDIGMTPPMAKIDGHLAFILSGDASSLGERDIESLQAWLDDEWDGITPPISHGAPSANELRLAKQMVAGYIRHRHTDWSAAWIRGRLQATQEPYSGWLEDLVSLAKSHHFNIDQLRSHAFDPRLVGSPATVVHLRYCACLLRVADVLDFDPERTPPILYRHRGVSDGSAIFWRKDQELSFELQGSHIVLHARPLDAAVHHAIDITVRDVNRELLLSRRLADETNFQHMSGRDEPLPHRWRMDTTVRSLITPRNDAYEYINGTFRPNPQRMLALLGGIELYGSHDAAVREIIQNAFDAVREQIARERLLQPELSSGETLDRIASAHRVSLIFEEAGPGEYRLSCQDTGTGMTRDIIHNRFLVGGISSSHEVRALERACDERGFSLGRTARFGIGVLSYFILGRYLTVHTRRSLEAGDPDGIGWTFTSGGLDDFGELKRRPDLQNGTEIVLDLREDLVGPDPSAFASHLSAYLSTIVRRSPCAFDFEAPGFDCPSISSSWGWVDRSADIRMILRGSTTDEFRGIMGSYGIATTKRKNWLRRRKQRYAAYEEDAEERLETHTFECPLPGELGSARIVIGTFRLLPGASFAYFDLIDESVDTYRLKSLPTEDGVVSRGQMTMSWNGMMIDADSASRSSVHVNTVAAVVEIDWTSDTAGQLAIHRHSFKPSPKAIRALRWLEKEITNRRLEILEEEGATLLALLNRRIVDSPPEESTPLAWPVEVGKRKVVLKRLETPTVTIPRYADGDRSALRWRRAKVCAARDLSLGTSDANYYRNISWSGTQFGPTSLGVMAISGKDRAVVVWENFKSNRSLTSVPHSAVPFPPAWRSLAVVRPRTRFTGGITEFFNANHPLVRTVDKEGWKWAEGVTLAERNPVTYSADMMKTPGRVAAWLLHCISGDGSMLEAVVEESPSLLANAWTKIDGLGEYDEILSWSEDESEEEGALLSILSLSPRNYYGYVGREAEREFAARCPSVDEAWRLVGWNEDDSQPRLKP